MHGHGSHFCALVSAANAAQLTEAQMQELLDDFAEGKGTVLRREKW